MALIRSDNPLLYQERATFISIRATTGDCPYAHFVIIQINANFSQSHERRSIADYSHRGTMGSRSPRYHFLGSGGCLLCPPPAAIESLTAAMLGNSAGNTLFFLNNGTAIAPSFAAPTPNPFRLTDVGYNSNPSVGAINNTLDARACQYNYCVLFGQGGEMIV